MNRPVTVDLFAEDRGHEAFLTPLIERIGEEEGVHVSIRVRSARGGHGRAIEEFGLYQELEERGDLPGGPPDLLVVAIDGNCTTFAKKRDEIRQAARPSLADGLVAACPDPHVERWYLADPESFERVVGHRPVVGEKKCERDHYKRLLTKAIRQAGQPAMLGGIEFAPDLVAEMDLYRAGRNDSSLRAFLDDLRNRLRRLWSQEGPNG